MSDYNTDTSGYEACHECRKQLCCCPPQSGPTGPRGPRGCQGLEGRPGATG